MDTQGKIVKLVNFKLTISKSSSSSTKSVGVTTRSMTKKIKDSSQISPLTEYVQKDFGSPNHASEDDRNKSHPSSPRAVSSHSFTINVAPVMVTNATTIEEQLASLTRAIEGFTKHVQEQDAQIARLIHKADNVEASHIMGKQVEAHDEAEKEEPVIDYINRWRNLSLNCKDRLSEAFAIEMCIQGMHWGLCYIIQGILPKFFEELATRAYDIELSMTASGVEGPPIQEFRRTKEKQEVKKGGKLFSKTPSKESMTVNVAPFKLKGIAKDSIAPKNNVPYEKPQRKLTLKKMQARQYPFLDSDVPRIFDDLLEANLIDLPEMKRLRKPNGRMIQSIANTIA
ncbi:UNVERIFIED_CONTAM: hypothetical protein Slati_3877600 [Sesamum latifolium]|uniref:Uncharacterized protein n=1 Tax=Sesamum latifolium TaxID=2727402 RepID=A0AAW2TMV8_9LAMI